jgi:hypothetical protein
MLAGMVCLLQFDLHAFLLFCHLGMHVSVAHIIIIIKLPN